MSDASRIDRNQPPPFTVVAKLFAKLTFAYGDRFQASLGVDDDDLPMAQEEWRQRLTGISPAAIVWAVANLAPRYKDHPINLLQFVDLCGEYRPPLELDGNALPDETERNKRHFNREKWQALRELVVDRMGKPKSTRDSLEWAHKVLREARHGGNVTPARLEMAQRALGQLVDVKEAEKVLMGEFTPIPYASTPEGQREAGQAAQGGPPAGQFPS